MNRARRGEGKPETFDFLGFTHCCAVRRSDGGSALQRRSIATRVRVFLPRIKRGLRWHYAESVNWQGQW